MKKWFVVFALISVAACSKKQESAPAGSGSARGSAAEPSAPPAQPVNEDESKGLEKNVAINTLSHGVKASDPASWPKDDVAGLDFTNETGNAVIVLRKTGGEMDEVLTNAPHFRLFHTEDDPYLVSQYVNGVGLADGETKETYRDKKYAPALQHIVRAKYALILDTELTRPNLDTANGKQFAPGVVKGKGVLFELDSSKVVGGVEFTGTNSEKVMVIKDAGNHPAKLVHDLEENTRVALRKALLARYPSSKVPSWTYYEAD